MADEQTELLKKILAQLEKGEVFGNLPLRGDWRWRPFDFSNVSLAVNETKMLINMNKSGWVVYGGVTLNNPGVSAVIEMETKTDKYRHSFTTNELYAAGLTSPQPTSWWNSAYVVLASLYSVQLTPSMWWPFNKGFKFSVENKTATAATILRAVVLCVEMLDVKP